MYALSSYKKVTLLYVRSHCGIQGDEDVDALAMEGLNSPFLSSEPAISIPAYVARLKVKECSK